ncbi:tRNA (N6-threonylcarbamoyladenosine(37)-N6)-methyltransferase TrmO [Acidianus manzaensis]|uniref:tRNA (N6-threonylcarbamoyladenosine(37)-N6)-methyltransferase TrmO n=1 Tax=Acidianus manzaensis TaxID=282676 RepID=A0A1W6JYI5_9CREN|nr:tRNA (N6-threonylcarbamoyladenosine(37)-N6)-methyltransferase TrmO [Acidianus manzaensis]ARM75305.1 tRNA (N6-threonylcarbamoyladenosine(37)-N6)-methyltransferase TrmO [Acidianus manzaensis]
MNIDLRQIGIVKSLNDKREGIIEIFPQYLEGLEGIENFSHIILLAWLHKVSEEQRNTLKVKPMRIQDLPNVGVFCTHSPHRPNPIALSIVRLTERKNNLLYVQNLDLFEETPILDIKTVSPSFCPKDIKVPEWNKELEKYKK